MNLKTENSHGKILNQIIFEIESSTQTESDLFLSLLIWMTWSIVLVENIDLEKKFWLQVIYNHIWQKWWGPSIQKMKYEEPTAPYPIWISLRKKFPLQILSFKF